MTLLSPPPPSELPQQPQRNHTNRAQWLLLSSHTSMGQRRLHTVRRAGRYYGVGGRIQIERMGSCISRERTRDLHNHLIVDVKEVIANAAWDEFVAVSSLRSRLFRPPKRSDYVVEVPMNYYLFQEDKPDFDVLKPGLESEAQSTSAAIGDKSLSDMLGQNTVFRNDTGHDQTYTFRFEKTKTSTVEVSCQKGFSVGGSLSVTLGLPKVLASGELRTELTTKYELTSSKVQKFEESVTTESTSEIKVSKMSDCSVQVLMEERCLRRRFKLRVTMSMPENQAAVYIRDKEGNTVFTRVIQNLPLLFDDSYHIKDDKGNVRVDAVQFMVHGVVDGKVADHSIHIKEQPIPAATSIKSGAMAGGAQKLTDVSDVELSDFQQ